MIIDLDLARSLATPAGAVVVVGSGAAGIALAEKMAASGHPVVLLESGRDVSVPSTVADDLNAGSSTGLHYSGLTAGRSRTLGGTTQLWHGQCMRLHDIDLQARSWVPHSGWPVELSDLSPHYRAAEEWLRITGAGYGWQRWQEHPRLTPLAWNEEHLLHDFTEYTRYPILGREHRPALAGSALIQVVLNATVGKVVVDADGVVGVDVFSSDGHRVHLAADYVVLSAGAIENARLLQLSDPAGIGLGDGAEHTGRFLQDHPVVRTAEVLPNDHRVLQDRYVALHRRHRKLFPKVRLAPQAQERFGLLDATAIFAHDFEHPALSAARRVLTAARARRRPERPLRDALIAARAPAPITRDAYRRYVRGLSTGVRPSGVWLQVSLEQAPDPDSRIRLGRDVDNFGMRRAQVHWRSSAQERETSRQMTRWIAQDLQRLNIAQVRELAPMHDDGAWDATVTDAFHPAGTTRMSRDPGTGVVDPDLQVHGIRGLYAVGGSVFPASGYANPTLTIVALALRLADHLSRRPVRIG